jgi:hypothetical protein
MLAYPLARTYYGTVGGLNREVAAARAAAETTSPKDILGNYFGYKGQPSYENSPFRQLGDYTGQVIGENIVTPGAQATGFPESDIANAVGLGSMAIAPAIPKVIKPVARAAYDVGAGTDIHDPGDY